MLQDIWFIEPKISLYTDHKSNIEHWVLIPHLNVTDTIHCGARVRYRSKQTCECNTLQSQQGTQAIIQDKYQSGKQTSL